MLLLSAWIKHAVNYPFKYIKTLPSGRLCKGLKTQRTNCMKEDSADDYKTVCLCHQTSCRSIRYCLYTSCTASQFQHCRHVLPTHVPILKTYFLELIQPGGSRTGVELCLSKYQAMLEAICKIMIKMSNVASETWLTSTWNSHSCYLT